MTDSNGKDDHVTARGHRISAVTAAVHTVHPVTHKPPQHLFQQSAVFTQCKTECSRQNSAQSLKKKKKSMNAFYSPDVKMQTWSQRLRFDDNCNRSEERPVSESETEIQILAANGAIKYK